MARRVTGARFPFLLGRLGLLPQVAALLVVALAPIEWRFAGVTAAQFYAGVILSFLGGIWWGLAARAEEPPRWLWIAAVVPSLWAFAALFLLQWGWNDAVLWLLAVGVLAALVGDRALWRRGLMPEWLWRLRVHLSVWLAGLTAAVALAS